MQFIWKISLRKFYLSIFLTCLFLIFSYYFFLFQPLQKKLTQVNQTNFTLQNQIKELENFIQKSQNNPRQYYKYCLSRNEYWRTITAPSSQKFKQHLLATINKQDLKLINLNVDKIKNEKGATENANLQIVGNYPQILSFLNDLGKAPHYFQYKDWSIQRQEKDLLLTIFIEIPLPNLSYLTYSHE